MIIRKVEVYLDIELTKISTPSVVGPKTRQRRGKTEKGKKAGIYRDVDPDFKICESFRDCVNLINMDLRYYTKKSLILTGECTALALLHASRL